MIDNKAASDWLAAQATAKTLIQNLKAGDYFLKWESDDDSCQLPSDMVISEVKALLKKSGLQLYSNDVGLRIIKSDN